METGITKNQILSDLSKSPHGKLEEYIPVTQEAARREPEFLSHLIAWNQLKGQIRDSKVALPVISLCSPEFTDSDFIENSLAHVALQGPRELERAFRFALELRKTHPWPGRSKTIRSLQGLIGDYLHNREANWHRWERAAVQHRQTLKALYALAHVKPCPLADAILFGTSKKHPDKMPVPKGSIFDIITHLKDMTPIEAAGEIIGRKIPFLVAVGALGKMAKETDLVLALINGMTPTELVTNTKMLEKLGIKTNPALRGAYEAAIAKAGTSKKATFKTTVAADAVEDEGLKAKLQALQEKQIKTLGGVEGNWAVLGDKSGSMSSTIEASRQVAATLARMVKGNVYLVFFDTSPRFINATGKTYDELLKETSKVRADGGTSIGVALQYLLDAKLEVDGIAVVSDAKENQNPAFTAVYARYAEFVGKQPPVYLYRCGPEYRSHLIPRLRMLNATSFRFSGDMDLQDSMKLAELDLQEFVLGDSIDHYALPNLVQTMRVNRYSILDEIMAVPLVTLKEVFKSERKEAVYAGEISVV